jgi:pimeloyl-ACP methyl ester carboxylesterase
MTIESATSLVKGGIASSGQVLAAHSQKPENKPTFVLIPGAWHGGWAWSPVAKRLRAARSTAVTLTMPGLRDGDDRSGLRLRDAVDHIVSEVNRRDLQDVTLVAHSWGGFPTSGAAHVLAGRVSKVIYYNAMVPAQGTSALEELPPGLAVAVRTAIAESPDGSAAAPLEVVQQMLMQDQPEHVQRLLWELLVPQPGGYGEDASEAPPVSTLDVPVTYILSEDDLAFGLPGAGVRFSDRLGVEPKMVPGSHESLLTHPDHVAQALLEG